MFDFIAEPFGWLLKVFYDFFTSITPHGAYALALVVFTLLAKLILLPFQMKSKKSMLGMQRIQPKVKELEKKYKDDKERYSLAVQQLYKEEKVSMMGGCLPLLLTFPIMLGLYAVIRQPLTFMFDMDVAQIQSLVDGLQQTNPDLYANLAGIIEKAGNIEYAEIQIADALGKIDFNLFGLNLAGTPEFSSFNWLWIIPALSGASSYFVSWISKRYQPQQNNDAAQKTGMMTMLMPLMSIWIAFIVPAGLGLYWIINNLLSAAQEPILQWYYTKYKPSKQKGEVK